MAARKLRGRREPKDITVESFSNEGPTPLLSRGNTTRSQTTSRPNSEESTFSNSNEAIGNTASAMPDQINFISGNPFVEVTKGILHLFKEE